MKALTKQQMFNKAVLGVVRQGALSIGPNGCAYRANVGGKVLACGVGQLIDDDLYTKDVEDVGVYGAHPDEWESEFWSKRRTSLCLALCFSGVDATDERVIAFLREIQRAHDSSGTVEQFVFICKSVADQHGLTMPRLPKQYA